MGDEISRGEEFLTTEYELLNEWARHAEDVAHRIFNFYVSVLTATLGGLFILLQLLASSSPTMLLVGAGVCTLLFLLGVVFYDSLISVNVRSAYYRAGMQVIQNHFRRYDAVRKSLVQFPIAFSEDGSKIKNPIGDQLTLVNFSFPSGNQQPLMAGINSLLLGGLIPCVVWSIGGVGFQLFGVLAAVPLVAAVSLFAHSWLTQMVVRRNMKALAAMFDLHSKLQDEDQPKRTQQKKEQERAGIDWG
jgi:hypothetical protein